MSSVLGADPTQFVIGLSSVAGGDIAVRSAVDRVQQLSTQAKSAEAEAAVAQGKVDVAKAQVDRYVEQLRQLAPYISSAQARAAALMAQRDGALAAMRAAQVGDLAGHLAQSDRIGAAIRAAQARLRAQGKVVQGTGTFTRPSTGPVTSHYGWRYHPVLHYRKLHTGVDLGQGDGYIRAADDGTVILTIANEAYGNVTVIDHGLLGGRRSRRSTAIRRASWSGPGRSCTRVRSSASSGRPAGPPDRTCTSRSATTASRSVPSRSSASDGSVVAAPSTTRGLQGCQRAARTSVATSESTSTPMAIR